MRIPSHVDFEAVFPRFVDKLFQSGLDRGIEIVTGQHIVGFLKLIVAVPRKRTPHPKDTGCQYVIETYIIATNRNGCYICIARVLPGVLLAVLAAGKDIIDFRTRAREVLKVDAV